MNKARLIEQNERKNQELTSSSDTMKSSMVRKLERGKENIENEEETII